MVGQNTLDQMCQNVKVSVVILRVNSVKTCHSDKRRGEKVCFFRYDEVDESVLNDNIEAVEERGNFEEFSFEKKFLQCFEKRNLETRLELFE